MFGLFRLGLEMQKRIIDAQIQGLDAARQILDAAIQRSEGDSAGQVRGDAASKWLGLWGMRG